jgi:hypothetical protein
MQLIARIADHNQDKRFHLRHGRRSATKPETVLQVNDRLDTRADYGIMWRLKLPDRGCVDTGPLQQASATARAMGSIVNGSRRLLRASASTADDRG